MAIPVAGATAYAHGLFDTNAETALTRGHYTRAQTLLRRDVARGIPTAATRLGNLYYLGLGVAADPERAASLYSRAAFAGDINAQVNLAQLYRRGIGLHKDTKLAYAWMNFARRNGSERAQFYMSEILAAHELSYHYVPILRAQYVAVSNFPKLHDEDAKF